VLTFTWVFAQDIVLAKWALLLGLCFGVQTTAYAQASDDAGGKAAAEDRFSSRVVADRVKVDEPEAIVGEPVRTQPGTLGDPFRVVSLLPGVVSPFPGLPLWSIRGASPGTAGFYLDGLRLPQLFHLLIGGGVVHSDLIDRVDFYPSGFDVTMGKAAGGIISASTRPARSDGNHFDLSLRLYDVGGLVELSLPKEIRISVSGHYGYPGPILRAIDNRIQLDYWDYQVRLDWRFLTFQVLGGYDALALSLGKELEYSSPQSTRTMFHRAQIRLHGESGKVSGEAALFGGYDEAGDISDRGVNKLMAGARGFVRVRLPRLSFQIGTELEVARFSGERFDVGLRSLAFVRNAEGPARVSGKDPDATPDELGEIGNNRVGITSSFYLHSELSLWPQRLYLTAGGRVDIYHVGDETLIGFDPRAQLRFVATPWLSLQASIGVYQQPPSFPVLLPGVDTFALKLGLQRAQSTVIAEEMSLPWNLSLRLTGFHQRFSNMTDLPPLGSSVCASPPPEKLHGTTATLVRVADGQAYGMEVWLRRSVGLLTGWISYTLSRSERSYPCGVRPADYDQTHVLQVVAQTRLPRGFVAGVRLQFSTGRPETLVDVGADNPSLEQIAERTGGQGVRNNFRLPNYVQLDVRIDKRWTFRRFYLHAFLEVVNATFSRTNLLLAYPSPDEQANGKHDPELIGFSWILPSIGLRGGF
jgi:hypothetical protein